MFQLLLKRFETFANTGYEYGIICDDDFYPVDNFLEELQATVSRLPPEWECLHLCPGFLWGRSFRDSSSIGKLCPEYDVTHLPYHTSGRYYNNCQPQTYFNFGGWLGGPIAVLVNRKSIAPIIHRYRSTGQLYPYPNDVLLSCILTPMSFICREPQLGYEREEGGSTFTQ